MVFCNVDDEFIGIINEIADGRRIIDIGAGECLFEYKYKQAYPDEGVVSIEIFPQDNYYIKRSDLITMNAVYFPFGSGDLPIFIRPCHSEEFVPEVLDVIKNIVPEAIYVSNPKNITSDIPEEYTYERMWNWVGDDGEQIYKIILNGPKWDKKDDEYYLVKLDPSWKNYNKMKKIQRNGEDWLVNAKGGGMPMKYVKDFKKFSNE